MVNLPLFCYTICEGNDIGELKHGRTCVFNINYHIVWSTKYRRKVLNTDIERRLKEILINVGKEKGLSNPRREYIPVTDQFLNEDYINWNGKAGNVGISGRNYPDGYILEDTIHQYITQMLGYSIAE